MPHKIAVSLGLTYGGSVCSQAVNHSESSRENYSAVRWKAVRSSGSTHQMSRRLPSFFHIMLIILTFYASLYVAV